MTIHIVGLGPGDPGMLTVEVRDLLASGVPVILRTRHHPTVAVLPGAERFQDCDDLYGASATFEDVYREAASRVLSAAASGDVIYATPGHPLAAERSVTGVIEMARAAGVEVRVHAGVSFADVAAVVLGIDLGQVQLCDALALRVDAQRPALISQVYDRDAASALKLQLLESYPADHPVTLLHALGTMEQSARPVPLSELDHAATGYLDCVFVPPLEPVDDVRRFDGLEAIVERLNAPDGCPWDREQTHRSLRPHLLEEAYETLEAIDGAEPESLAEELGDLLLQVLMHAAVAERTGEFALADVVEQIARKLVRRHPHVFGEVEAKTADDVYRNWEKLKQAERPRSSILEGIPASLPALAASQSIQGRARRIGFDWPDIQGPLDKLVEEVREFAEAEGAEAREDEFGDVLFVVANIAQRLDIDAEQALRGANAKFRRRFGQLEAIASAEGLDLHAMDLAALDALWERAKVALAAGR